MQHKIRQHDPRAFLSTQEFRWIQNLEKNWETIRDELSKLLRDNVPIPAFHEVSSAQKNISKGQQWKTFVLYAYGHQMQQNCSQCPETVELLSAVPHMTTAMFSIFRPGTRVPVHTGPYNGYLRYHLGLIVPKETKKCAIRIKNEVRHWKAGKSLVFDGTFEHEVWNETDEIRVVLFLDFLRPLPRRLSLGNMLAHKLIKRSDKVMEAVHNVRGEDFEEGA